MQVCCVEVDVCMRNVTGFQACAVPIVDWKPGGLVREAARAEDSVRETPVVLGLRHNIRIATRKERVKIHVVVVPSKQKNKTTLHAHSRT